MSAGRRERPSAREGRPGGRIGTAFPHNEGPGLNVQLKALPVDGKLVLLPPDTGDTAR